MEKATYKKLKEDVRNKVVAFDELCSDWITEEGKQVSEAYNIISWYMNFFDDKQEFFQKLEDDLNKGENKCQYISEYVKHLLHRFIKTNR